MCNRPVGRAGSRSQRRLTIRDPGRVALLWVVRGFTMPKAWPYGEGESRAGRSGAGLRCRMSDVCDREWRPRPGTCRAPMGCAGGFTMPKAWPYKSGEYLMGYGRIGKRDPGRVALLWVGERKREVATKATSLQSRISS